MHIVGGHQLYAGILAKTQQLWIDHFLLGHTMVLQLQEKIAFTKTFLVSERRFLRFLITAPLQLPLYFSGQTGAGGYDAFVISLQHFHIHPWFIIIAFHKTFGNDFDQIAISCIIFSQQHQMIIPVLPACIIPVKPGIRRHINLTAQNWSDTCGSGGFIKIYNAVHGPVVRDCRRIHAQLPDPGDIFTDFIGTVQ